MSTCGFNEVSLRCRRTIGFVSSASLSLLFRRQRTEKVDFSFNSLADPRFTFHDHALVEAVKLENPEVHAFFRLLALCHTVMVEEKKEGERDLNLRPFPLGKT